MCCELKGSFCCAVGSWEEEAAALFSHYPHFTAEGFGGVTNTLLWY